MTKKVWIEPDENMLDGVDIKKVIPKLDEVLMQRAKADSLNQTLSKKLDENSLVAKILKRRPDLTLEKVEKELELY